MKTMIGNGTVVTTICIAAVLAGCRGPKAVYEWGDGRRATVEGMNRVTFSQDDQDGLSVATGDKEQPRDKSAPPDNESAQKALDISAQTQTTSVGHADRTLVDRVSELKGRRDQLQRSIEEFGMEAEQVRADLAVACRKRDQLLAEIRVEEARLTERRHEREAEEKVLEESRAAHAGLLGELEARRAEVDQAQRAVVALNRRIDELGTARDKVQADSAEAQRELDALRDQVKKLGTEKTATAEALAVVSAELTQAKKKLAVAEVEIRERKQQLRHLNEARGVAEQAAAAVRIEEQVADVVPRIPQANEPAETLPPSASAVPEPVEEDSGPMVIDSQPVWWSRGRWIGLALVGVMAGGGIILISRRLMVNLMPDLLTVVLTELTAEGSDHYQMQIDQTQAVALSAPPRVLSASAAGEGDLPWIRRGAVRRVVLAGGVNGVDVNLNGEPLNGNQARLCEGDRITIGQNGSQRVLVVQAVAADDERDLFAQEPETV